MKRILIVDDDVTICRLVASILEDSYDISYATDMLTARQLLEESRFDLIIADYFLGAADSHANGWPLGDVCKALAPQTPVVALTGLDPSLQAILKAGGARAIVPKPFDMDYLIGTVDQTIS